MTTAAAVLITDISCHSQSAQPTSTPYRRILLVTSASRCRSNHDDDEGRRRSNKYVSPLEHRQSSTGGTGELSSHASTTRVYDVLSLVRLKVSTHDVLASFCFPNLSVMLCTHGVVADNNSFTFTFVFSPWH